MKINEITIIIDFKIYAYLFEPIIPYLLGRNVKVTICLPDALKPQILLVYSHFKNLNYTSLTRIKDKNRFRFGIHRACSILFTRTDFSFQFRKKREQSTKKFNGLTGFLLKISKFTPKVANSSINKFLSSISSFGLSNPFPTEVVFVGSLNASAELLGARGLKVVTIMESWDHAVKEPNGYQSSLFLGWNKDLCRDWENTQGDTNCRVLHPLKLRYAHEQFVRKFPVTQEGRRIRVMYPLAGTSKFSINIMVELEKKIVRELIKITKILGWELYLKPRPNGLVGEFSYAEAYDHVQVGEVSHGDISNPADYFYSESDNYERFRPLNDIDLVINAFTTFGLDSVAAKIPVLQLDLRECNDFKESFMIYENYHIKHYLISSKNVLKPINENLSDCFIRQQKEVFKIATSYQLEILNWLYQYSDCDDAISSCFNEYLRD